MIDVVKHVQVLIITLANIIINVINMILYKPLLCLVTPPFCTFVTMLLHVMLNFAESRLLSLFTVSVPLCGTTASGAFVSSVL